MQCGRRVSLTSLTAAILIIATSRESGAEEEEEADELRRASNLFQQALNAKSVTEEENGWTRVIDAFEGTSWAWTTELVSRALGNRGNARSRQGKLGDALEDYNKSIAMSPTAPDPLLNRGVLHETMRDFDLALQDYHRVLDLNPSDAAAYNNIGNTQMQIGEYTEAVSSLEKARALVSGGSFAFADTNLAMALFLSGDTKRSFSLFRRILTRYVRCFYTEKSTLTSIIILCDLCVCHHDKHHNNNNCIMIRYRHCIMS